MQDLTVVDHLSELRKRVVISLIIVVVFFFGCYGVGAEICEFLLVPLRDALGGSDKIVFLGILDKVLSLFQIAFWSAIILSSPFWFYQIWLFIKPALGPVELKMIRPFIFLAFLFFCAGVLFGYYVVFPVVFKVLMEFGVSDVSATISLKDYLILTVKVLVFLGMIFQLPNVLLILGLLGVVNRRSISNSRRYVYVGLTIFSACLTPPDVLTMLGLWIPMIVLFEIGGVLVWLVGRRQPVEP